MYRKLISLFVIFYEVGYFWRWISNIFLYFLIRIICIFSFWRYLSFFIIRFNFYNVSVKIPYFDKDSLVIKKEDFINEEKVLECLYKYDKNKNKISQENFYLYGGSKTKTVWKYNNNKLVEYLDYDNGNFSESVKYDEKERLIEKKEVGEEGIHITSYKYDVKNNLIEDIYKTDKTCFITTYKYIDNKKLEEITKHCNSKEIKSKETFNYDSNNNLIEIASFSKEPTRIITSNKIFKNFDAQGNWTQKIYYYNGEAIGLTERTIEYY